MNEMKKLLFLLVAMCAYTLGTWAEVSVYSSTYQTDTPTFQNNGSFLHVNITVTGDAGQIATDIESALKTANVTAGDVVRLSINGNVNAADLTKLAEIFGSSENLLSLKLEGATLSSNSDITSFTGEFPSVTGLILPSSFKDIDAKTVAKFTNEKLAAIAYDKTEGSSFMVAYNKTAGYLVNALGASSKWQGTTYDKVTLKGNYGKATINSKEVADLNYLRANSNDIGTSGADVKDLDLTDATFANYEGETVSGTTQNGVEYNEETNGLALIGSLFKSTLTSLELPRTPGTTLLPYQALINCNSLKTLTIPSNITTLGTQCCATLGALETLVCEGITAVAPEAFESCKVLTSVTLPSCCKTIGAYAFNECLAIEGIAIPDGVTVIDKYAFAYCQELKAVRLPNSLVTIGDAAFLQCLELASITIPAKVESIGHSAFARCISLMDVYVLGTTTVPNTPYDAFDSYTQFVNGSVNNVSTYWDQEKGTNVGKVNRGSYMTTRNINNENVTTGAALLHFPEGMGDIYSCETNRNSKYQGTFEASETWPDDYGITKWADATDLWYYWTNNNINPQSQNPNSDGAKALGYGDWTNSDINGGATTNTDGFKLFILTKQSDKEDVYVFDHIKKDVWNTICVPFDITAVQLEETFGNGYEVAEFDEVKYEDNKLYLNFTKNISEGKSGSDVVIEKHVPYMIHPNSMAVDAEGKPAETTFTITGVSFTDDDYNADATVMQDKAITITGSNNAGKFTFIGIGHNNIYDKTNKIGKRVLLPCNCYFLGTAKGATYPKFYRESAKDDGDRATGLWTNNCAVVLAPGWKYEKPETYNVQSDDYAVDENGTVTAGYQTWKSGYTMDPYKYPGSTSTTTTGAKVFSSFEFVVNDDPLKESTGETTGISEVVSECESNVPAAMQGKVFNMNGQCVGTSIEGLPSGLYIMNGKKIVVK